MRLATHLWLALVLGSQWTLTPNAGAAEIDLLADGLGLTQCFDPDATVPGGLTAGVVRNRRVYGPVDEFPGARLNTLTRGGSFNPSFKFNLLQAARLQLELELPMNAGPANNRFEELLQLLVDDRVLRPAELGIFRALTASSERARAAGDIATADALEARAAALVAGTFDAPVTIRELLAALAPRDRLRDLLDPNFLTCDPNTNDRVSHWAIGLATNILGLRSAPGGIDSRIAALNSVPFLVGRDGIRNTADDLPFLQAEKGMQIVPPGMDAFHAVNFENVVAVDVPSGQVEFYGRFKEDVIVNFGCEIGHGNLGGAFDPATGICTKDGADITSEARERGCKGLTSDFNIGGFNADGDCIQLDVMSEQRPFELLAVLGDLELRPEGAQLEPCDLTDLKLIANGHGKGLPARPRSAGGTLTFPVAATTFERRVDAFTGAPVRSTGARICRYRTASGGESPNVADSVGPDGIAGNRDDAIASVGNCLLFDNPSDPSVMQALRESDAIALSHPVNQTFFHALCTASFDPITGFCALDILNSPSTFSFVSSILAGGFIGGRVTDGLRFIRTTTAPFDSVFRTDELNNTIFAQIPGVDLSELSPGEKARLGCGPAFVSPCGVQDVRGFANSFSDADIADDPTLDDPSILRLLEGRTADTIGGGPDLMFADADFLTQEFTTRKEIDVGGYVEPLPWAPDPNWLAQGVLVYQVANQNELDPRCHFQEDKADLFDPDNPVCFDSSGVRKILTFSDPTDASNPLNVFRPGSGESCIQSFGDTGRFLSGSRTAAFDAGCTNLETVSANLERLLIGLDILGWDRVPDPVESLEELWNILDGDPNTNLDPLAGPDGRFVANLAIGLGNAALADANMPPRFELGEKETHVVRNEVRRPDIGIVPLRTFAEPGDNLALGNNEELARASENFMRDYDPTTCPVGRCHLGIFEDIQLTQVEFNELLNTGLGKELVTAVPVSIAAFTLEFNDAGDIIGPGPTHVNLLKIYYQDPVAFASLLDPFFQDEEGRPFVSVQIDGNRIGVVPIERSLFLDNVNFVANCQDLDADGLCDWDHDDDGVYDGTDDYTDGKSTDDGLFCGSGLPGDVLQEAIQLDFAHPSDEAAFAAAFPNGLPPRSPVFCGSLQKLIGLTGESAPDRRDFVWHGGERSDDPDADGWPDLVDICPFVPNEAQEDSGGIGAGSGPDGIGDACQCGDPLGDGIIDADDVLLLRLHLAFPSIVLTPQELEMCNRIAATGTCDILEVTLLRRAIEGLAPDIGQTCELALAP